LSPERRRLLATDESSPGRVRIAGFSPAGDPPPRRMPGRADDWRLCRRRQDAPGRWEPAPWPSAL